MAKKKLGLPMAVEYTPPVVHDNNPDGVCDKPEFGLDGTRFPKGKVSFVNMVADGESQNRPDVNVITANGVSSSTGKGKNAQYNWGTGTDGSWNKNEPFDGGNMTGQ